MDNSNRWTEIKVRAQSEYLDSVVAVMSRVDPALVIEDNRDLGADPMYGELVDESILLSDKQHISVTLYMPDGDDSAVRRAVEGIKERLGALGICAELSVNSRSSSEWEENWKKYYTPQHIGRVTIVPAWDTEYERKQGETLIFMDPGMAFGTGSHETTRLVIGMLEDYVGKDTRMLDIGCGSGILSICARKLGAAECRAYDLDPDAVRVARENTGKNGVPEIECGVSDLLSSVVRPKNGYTLVAANIVAEIIVRMLPDLAAFLAPGADVLLSGIIDKSLPDVLSSLALNGYTVLRTERENDWVALAVRKN